MVLERARKVARGGEIEARGVRWGVAGAEVGIFSVSSSMDSSGATARTGGTGVAALGDLLYLAVSLSAVGVGVGVGWCTAGGVGVGRGGEAEGVGEGERSLSLETAAVGLGVVPADGEDADL